MNTVCGMKNERNCTGDVVGKFTWGNYPNGSHNLAVPLCQECLNELWERIRALVTAAVCHFEVSSK